MRISDWSSDVCSSDLEIYTALERGTFQAASLPFSYAHATYKLHEVSKWYTYGMAPGTVNCPLVVRRSAFDKLPADRKSVVQGKSVSVRVDLGGPRIIKTNTHNYHHTSQPPQHP